MTTNDGNQKESRTIIKREGPVRIIGMNKLHKDVKKNARIKDLGIYSTCFIFVLISIVLLWMGENVIICLLGVLFFGGLGLMYFKIKSTNGAEYIPGKSFIMYRGKKETLRKILLGSIIFCVIFIIVSFYVDDIRGGIGYAIGALIAFIYSIMSLKVHEDVDFSTNQALEDIIGMEVDEHIWGSYQNFDSTALSNKQNDNIMVVTDRKIFYANYSDGKWFKLMRYMDEVLEIGIVEYGNYQTYLKLRFTDNTYLGFRLSLYNKMTSNPNLFIRRFLLSLDASILGGDKVQTLRRRRVVISQKDVSLQNDNTLDNSYIRKIELTQSTLLGLSTAEEYASGRQIEL